MSNTYRPVAPEPWMNDPHMRREVIRQQIAAGTYDTDAKLSVALDRAMDAVEREGQHSENADDCREDPA